MTRPGSRPRRGPSRTLRLVVALALATAAGLFIAATTEVGPVLLRITENHGVHLFDVAAFAAFYAAALVGVLAVRRTGLLVGYALATFAALVIASSTRIGPVLVTLPPSLRIELGDLLAFPACYAVVAVAGLLRPARPDTAGARVASGGVAQPGLPRR